jgi:alcohol dehydrogenase class IV
MSALHGSYLGGRALEGGIALHHKLCHLLGGRYGLPHAETHTALLPHVAAFHRACAPDAMARVGRALATADAPGALYDLARSLGAATGLGELGLPEQELDALADRAAALEVPLNPRPLERDALRKLVGDAFAGARPDPGH